MIFTILSFRNEGNFWCGACGVVRVRRVELMDVVGVFGKQCFTMLASEIKNRKKMSKSDTEEES